MTTAQVVETSVTVNNNSPIQDYVPMDGRTQPTFDLKLSLKAGRNCLKSMRSGWPSNDKMGRKNFYLQKQAPAQAAIGKFQV